MLGATSHNLLEEMGFDLTKYQVFTTEFWVQEFAKKGGGHPYFTYTLEWSHIWFLFLKASEKTSLPVFEDPRPGNIMNLLPKKINQKLHMQVHKFIIKFNQVE